MPHPNDGDILAWLDDELEREDGVGVGEHLRSCEQCRARVDILRRESEGFTRAVLMLDDGLAGVADPGPFRVAVAVSGSRKGRSIRNTGWSLARAAALILVAAGAAAAFVPGSPVRVWLDGLWEADVPATAVVVEPRMETPEEAEVTPGPTAISIEPHSGSLVVSLQGFGLDSNVHVRLTDSRRASVRVEGAAESPRFITGPGLVEVIGAEEGDIWVELPRSARDAVVRVDGEAAVRIRDGRLVILRPVLDSLRGEVVFRIGD